MGYNLNDANHIWQLFIIVGMLAGIAALVIDTRGRYLNARLHYPVPNNQILKTNLSGLLDELIKYSPDHIANHVRFTIFRVSGRYLHPAERTGSHEDQKCHVKFGLGEGLVGQAWDQQVKRFKKAPCRYQDDPTTWANNMSISVEKAHKLNIHPDAIECIPIKHNREVIAVLSIDLWEPGDDWDGDWIGQLEGKIGSYLSLQIFQSKAC